MKPDEIASIQVAASPRWSLGRAILVYFEQDRDPLYGTNRGERAYATLHTVTNGKGGPRLSAGVPATREACADLSKALGENAKLGGFIPPNLLYLGARSIIWWRPPARGKIFFDTTHARAGDQLVDPEGAARIGKRGDIVPHPGLVFAVAGSHWYVYAVAGKDRPEPHTTLWRAPYFNVWAEGEICQGNVRLPEVFSAQTLDAYEKAFFDSEFTHPNMKGKAKLVNYSSGPYGFWADILKACAAPDFPVQHLVKLNLTVEGLAKRLEKGGRGALGDLGE